MRLQHVHHLGGPGRVIVTTPKLPVFITIDENAKYRSVDIMADRGQYAWAGPAGLGRVSLGVEAGWQTPGVSLKNLFRTGSYISGGGSSASGGPGDIVRATGRGSVAAGGNISDVALGKNSHVSSKGSESLPDVGVHILAPERSIFEIKSALSVTVFIEDKEATLDPVNFLGGPWSATLIRNQIVVGR